MQHDPFVDRIADKIGSALTQEFRATAERWKAACQKVAELEVELAELRTAQSATPPWPPQPSFNQVDRDEISTLTVELARVRREARRTSAIAWILTWIAAAAYFAIGFIFGHEGGF